MSTPTKRKDQIPTKHVGFLDNEPGLFLDMPSLPSKRSHPSDNLPEVQLRLYGLGLAHFVRTREPPKHIYEDLKMRIPRYDVTFVSDSRPSRNVTIYDTNTYECHSGNM
jgi:hypothetical protein